jgi:hypothetical protein
MLRSAAEDPWSLTPVADVAVKKKGEASRNKPAFAVTTDVAALVPQ